MKNNQKSKAQLIAELEVLQKQAKEDLHPERDILTNIFKAMVDGVYIVDQEFNIQYVNPVLVKDFGNYQNRKCYEYFHQRSEVCTWCKNKDVFAGKTVRWEWYSEKTKKTYDLIDTPLKNSDGSISKLEIFRDITKQKKAEEILGLSKRVLEASPNHISVIGTDFKYKYVNNAYTMAHDLDAKHITGMYVVDLLGKQIFETLVKPLLNKCFSGEEIHYESWFTFKKIGSRFMSVRYLPLITEKGHIDSLVVISQDNTEQKKADESLKESEEKYKALSENAILPVIIHDINGKILYANSKSIEVLKAKNILEIYNTSVFNTIHKLIMFNGEKAIQVTFVDITERVQLKKALQKSEEKFKTIAEFSYDWVFWLGTDANYIYVSPAVERITGYTPQDFYNNNEIMKKIIHPEDLPLYSEHQHQEINGKIEPIDFRIITKKGEIRWIGHVCREVVNEDGESIGRRSSNRDITDRILAEEKIKDLLIEKKILLKEVHHRIKNNMNVIKSLLSLQSKSLDNPEATVALQDAIGRVNSMGILYDKLYKTENYKNISVKEYFPQLIDEIIKMFPNSKSVQIETRFDDFIVGMKNIYHIGIIINELITNSMKYAFSDNKEGLIRVDVTKHNNHITFIYEDDGIGMPKIDENVKKGFGLSLIELLVRQIKGTKKIENRNGTKYIIEFDL